MERPNDNHEAAIKGGQAFSEIGRALKAGGFTLADWMAHGRGIRRRLIVEKYGLGKPFTKHQTKQL